MTPDQINDFFSFLYRGTLGEITFWLRLIAGVFISAMLGVTAVIAVKFRELNMGGPKSAASLAKPRMDIAAAWAEAARGIESANPADWNLALIRADAVFDAVLKDVGIGGDTLGERLAGMDRTKLRSLDAVWEAHKLRNRIAHETGQVLAHDDARRAVAAFEKALRELQYLI